MTALDDRLRAATASLKASAAEAVPPFRKVRQRVIRRRLTTGAAVMLVFGIAAAGIVAATARPGASRVIVAKPNKTLTTTAADTLEHFVAPERAGLAFDHPAIWRETLSEWNTGTFGHPIVYLSDAKLEDPCTRSSSGTSVSTSCGSPINALPAGDVLITWGAYVMLGGNPVSRPNTTISGQPATVEFRQPGDCSRIGGDETITADIAQPPSRFVVGRGAYFEMVACMRGPNLAGNEALVRGMLRSVHLAKPL